ncbi:hypothetical protein FRC20_011227 [Serendipita sp. 405]|nr:hypothetical protein FRC20_011227 [Serendipita sp. 405]
MALALYRSILREAGYLPHPYVQLFVKGRTKDYFRTHRNAQDPSKYLKRARCELRKLQRINAGAQKPFMRLLWYTFGRTGAFRRELIKPHFAESYPNFPKREAIIPGVEESRPPSYPPTLLALVTSAISKTTDKQYSAEEVLNPRKLPERADPTSEEARLLGPFSLRRKKNIHRRFFVEQTDRILPPLAVSSSATTADQTKPDIFIPSTGLERWNPMEMLEILASPNPMYSPPSRSKPEDRLPLSPTPRKSGHLRLGGRSSRWLRRRYRELLASIPTMKVRTADGPQGEEDEQPTEKIKGKKSMRNRSIQSIPNPERPTTRAQVAWSSDLVLSPDKPGLLRSMTARELQWIRDAELSKPVAVKKSSK